MMFWSLFGVFLVVIVVLRIWHPWRERCPVCHAVRQEQQPLCVECGWIYEVPGDEDDDYGEPEEQETAHF